jgi:hypothetical protein
MANNLTDPTGELGSSPMDPQENPVGTGHLPASGEVGVGAVPYHDPTTTDTNDDPDSAIDTPPPGGPERPVV